MRHEHQYQLLTVGYGGVAGTAILGNVDEIMLFPTRFPAPKKPPRFKAMVTPFGIGVTKTCTRHRDPWYYTLPAGPEGGTRLALRANDNYWNISDDRWIGKPAR